MSPTTSAVVPRGRLLDLFDVPALAPITLITAPAGYGKSTLVRQWAARHATQRCGWYQIRAEHNALGTFLHHVWRAIDESAGIPEPLPDDIGIGHILERLAAHPAQIVLVLDDYHVIENDLIHQAVEHLFRDLPSSTYIMLLSRQIPAMPLARHRAYGRLRQITQDDLAFTFEEVKQVFEGLCVSDDMLHRLTQKSEGWIAGLQLLSMSVNLNSDHASEQLDRLMATMPQNRLLSEYIVEEVIDALPEDLRRFVLDTSFLDVLDPALCDAVLQINSSSAYLARLENAIVFVGRPGGAGRPLTYHRLFAECMQGVRQRSGVEPSAAELRLRASRWYRGRGDFEEAAEYALAAEAWDEAAKNIGEFIPFDFAYTNIWDSLYWLGRLPEAALRQDLALLQSYISAMLANGRIDDARPLVESFLDTPGVELTPRQLGWHANQCAYLAYADGDRDEALYQSYRALSLLPWDDPSGRLLAWSGVHRQECVRGERKLAQAMLRQAEADHKRQPRESIYWHLLMAPDISNDAAIQGNLFGAEELNNHFIKNLPPPLETAVGAFKMRLLCIHLEQNRLDLAAAEVDDILADLQERKYLIWYSEAMVAVANYYLAIGDRELAWHTLERSAQVTRQYGGYELVRKAETGIANYWLQTGQDGLAQLWADSTALPPYVVRAFGDVEPRILRAQLLFRQHRYDEAAELLTQSLALARGCGNVAIEIALEVWASVVARTTGARDQANDFLRHALELGTPGRFVRVYGSTGFDLSDPIRAVLPELSEAAQWHAASLVDTTSAKESTTDSLWGEARLTQREREVLAELVLGKSNREISDSLYISERTVKKHLANLFRKTGTTNRTTVAIWGRERLLQTPPGVGRVISPRP